MQNIIKIYLYLFFILIASGSNLKAQGTPDPNLTRELRLHTEKVEKELIKSNSSLRISVYRIPDFQEVFSLNQNDFTHAASTQKLFVTYAALKILGAEYSVPTEFYTDFIPSDRDTRLDVSIGLSNKKTVPEDSLGNLYIRGYGDPSFQFDHIISSVLELKARGLNGVNDLIIDDSLFIEKSEPGGDEPYLAAQSATPLEFNTYRIQMVPSSSGLPANISISQGVYGDIINSTKSLRGKGESIDISQSPDNKTFMRVLKDGVINLQPLKINITGRIGLDHPYYEKYKAHPDPFQYYSISFRKALNNQGISVTGSIKRGKVPDEAKNIYTFESEPLYSILSKLNRYSSNFISGQLLYLIGQDEKGYFSSSLGLKRIRDLIDEISCSSENMKLVDASGLSTDNRISTYQLVCLLNEVVKDFSISPVFISSLSRFGLSGTLKKRILYKDSEDLKYSLKSVFKHDNIKKEATWSKTGSVDGVRALTGYIERYEGFRLAYAMIIKGNIEKSRAIEIEDDIIRLLLGK